jgi:ureidoglycolate dehydrogenase (NAD+)
MVQIPTADLKRLCTELLACHEVRPDVAHHVVQGLMQASLRGIDSHGVRLLPHYLRALEAGRLNPNPDYRFERTAAATGTLDGDHTFGHAAGAEGMGHAMDLARENGLGAVAVRNSSHFGSAAYYSLMAAEQGMIGLSFTHADALMLTYGGKRPYFGTNPICFAAPCQDEEPFCLDMATTSVTWNKVLHEYNQKGSVPLGWGVDAEGNDAHSPESMVGLHPIGGYKGFGLGMMVDVLCGVLTGMPFGRHISRMYGDPIEDKRYLGHFFLAVDIQRFIPLEQFKANMQQMMKEVRAEPPQDPKVPLQVAGDPEKTAYAERSRKGVILSDGEWEEFTSLARKCGLTLPKVLEVS